ncbi:PDZ-binding protein [Globomyces pollinis-pini]|nr:PDZ-binding protein [Globomyces pollinis-pini]
MVCQKCEKKQDSALITPDTWKEGSRSSAVGSAGRKLNENKLLSSKNKNKFAPYEKPCRLCKKKLHQKGMNYCQNCSYKKGICSMCGISILDVTKYKQSTK